MSNGGQLPIVGRPWHCFSSSLNGSKDGRGILTENGKFCFLYKSYSRQHAVSWCFNEHRQISTNICRSTRMFKSMLMCIFWNSELTNSKAILGVTMSAEKPCREAIQLQKVQFTRSSVYTMQHQTVPYNTMMSYNTMKHHETPCNSAQYHTIPFNIMQ